jgi:hypothetical protein
MARRFEVVVTANIELSDEQMARCGELMEWAPGLSVEQMLADETSLWWQQFEDAAIGGSIELTAVD